MFLKNNHSWRDCLLACPSICLTVAILSVHSGLCCKFTFTILQNQEK